MTFDQRAPEAVHISSVIVHLTHIVKILSLQDNATERQQNLSTVTVDLLPNIIIFLSPSLRLPAVDDSGRGHHHPAVSLPVAACLCPHPACLSPPLSRCSCSLPDGSAVQRGH